ncbi:MAG: error-prone DNA polymerase [Alphaproteobacteria bacterium]|nr:error-prone DNA polymerase [Alphaproteobacteria bacterium]
MSGAAFAELIAATNYSFLRGASHPHEMVARAAELGHRAIGVADRNTLAGVVRAHVAAKEAGIRLVIGARLVTTDGFETVCHPEDRAAYGRLARALTAGNRRARKGECHLGFADIVAAQEGQIFIVIPPTTITQEFSERMAALVEAARGRVHLAAIHRHGGDERRRLGELAMFANRSGARLVATTDALYHDPARRMLADVLACIREKCTIADAGFRLEANAERHLKSPAEMARLFADHPDAVARSAELAGRTHFSLDALRYEYPDEPVPPGRTAQEHLEALTWDHAATRYPSGVPDKVRKLLRKELALIATLGYARYFLTVYDVVRFARGKDILCQGRGSAANSAVCYCLGITAVDPSTSDLLFERFISAERREPPDIDVDFEHERREEVIQYLYDRYGRERAAICATVIHYRTRSAIRQVGKALGLKDDVTAALANTIWGWGGDALPDDYVRQAGLDPANPALRMALDLVATLLEFPRHLSQHVGGFVLTRSRLDETVPIHNGAMADRTFLEWDKDDIDALGMLKVDVLALGMLTCIRKGFALILGHYGKAFTLASVPAEDPQVYDMLCRADSIGVFQVESRAQMSMLPRLQPRTFYDLVIEVAIVRPGPIQGDMVHPYLRRREGKEPIEYPKEELRAVLEKTKGVPLFQEQAMQIAIVAAGFSPDESDKLRRAMATFRHVGTIHKFRDKFIEGMAANGYARDFAERCFRQIEGFGEYGFPESHAASFALLVYVSAWMKCHYPAAFACALLNSQPMGFYAPAQIVRDAREHGVAVLPVDVGHSEWDCTLEPDPAKPGAFALRLGLRQVKGAQAKDGEALIAARAEGHDPLVPAPGGARSGAIETLARADAFRSRGLDRRTALWAAKRAPVPPLPLFAAAKASEHAPEPAVTLPDMTLGEHVAEDYRTLRLSLKEHPMALLRAGMAARGHVPARDLATIDSGRRVRVSGIVLVRQRPGTASGVIFATLEDESGVSNIIVWPKVFERYRPIVLGASLLAVEGELQREGIVTHVIAERLADLSDELRALAAGDDVAAPLARADEVKRPGNDARAAIQRRKVAASTRDPAYKSRDFH